jgi:hypothetical protein
MSKEPKPWTMPKWMQPFAEFINNTGGNEIDDLVNDHETTVEVNAPRAIICVAVKAQVILLQSLMKHGLLRTKFKRLGENAPDGDYAMMVNSTLAPKLPEDTGFALFVFNLDKSKPMCRYISNVERIDCATVLASFLRSTIDEEKVKEPDNQNTKPKDQDGSICR